MIDGLVDFNQSTSRLYNLHVNPGVKNLVNKDLCLKTDVIKNKTNQRLYSIHNLKTSSMVILISFKYGRNGNIFIDRSSLCLDIGEVSLVSSSMAEKFTS